MTTLDALLILDLSAPISREMLNKAYEDGVKVWRPESFAGSVALQAKAKAKTDQLYAAYSLLFEMPDGAHPFQKVAGPAAAAAGGGEKLAALPKVEAEPRPEPRAMPRAMTPRPKQMGLVHVEDVPPPPAARELAGGLSEAPMREAEQQPGGAHEEQMPEVRAEAKAAPQMRAAVSSAPPPLPVPVPETEEEERVLNEEKVQVPTQPQTQSQGKRPKFPNAGAPKAEVVPQLEAAGLPGGWPAPFLYRAGAWVIDYLLFTLFMVLTGMGNLFVEVNQSRAEGGELALKMVLQLAACGVFALLYSVVLESSAMQATLGKKACGLVVTDMEGRRISVGRATARFFARLLSWPVTLGLGYLLGAVTRKRQCLHDMVSRCLVRRAAPESAGVAAGMMPEARTPRVLIFLGVGAVAGIGVWGCVYYLSNREISSAADPAWVEPTQPAYMRGLSEAKAPVAGVSPAPTAAPAAPVFPAPDATGTGRPGAWRKGLPLAEVMNLAGAGDARAQSELGFAFANGKGVSNIPTEAVKWLRKAAEQGEVDAQFGLGYMYRMGEGVAKDDAEAVKWYAKAAAQGQALAQADLASAYFTGEGVAKDDAVSVQWMRKAAEQNLDEAQDSLGSAYQYGVGVAKDEAAAVKWYQKAADQHYALAEYHLGACYEGGVGVAKDVAEALKWYRKAKAQGNAEAAEAAKRVGGG